MVIQRNRLRFILLNTTSRIMRHKFCQLSVASSSKKDNYYFSGQLVQSKGAALLGTTTEKQSGSGKVASRSFKQTMEVFNAAKELSDKAEAEK